MCSIRFVIERKETRRTLGIPVRSCCVFNLSTWVRRETSLAKVTNGNWLGVLISISSQSEHAWWSLSVDTWTFVLFPHVHPLSTLVVSATKGYLEVIANHVDPYISLRTMRSKKRKEKERNKRKEKKRKEKKSKAKQRNIWEASKNNFVGYNQKDSMGHSLYSDHTHRLIKHVFCCLLLQFSNFFIERTTW